MPNQRKKNEKQKNSVNTHPKNELFISKQQSNRPRENKSTPKSANQSLHRLLVLRHHRQPIKIIIETGQKPIQALIEQTKDFSLFSLLGSHVCCVIIDCHFI
jgi:hypothetical protein